MPLHGWLPILFLQRVIDTAELLSVAATATRVSDVTACSPIFKLKTSLARLRLLAAGSTSTRYLTQPHCSIIVTATSSDKKM